MRNNSLPRFARSPSLRSVMGKGKSADKKDIRSLENFLGAKPEIETTYNRPDALPFLYHNEIPDGLIKWVCSEGPNGEIISVYEFRPNQVGAAVEYREMILKNFDEAKKCREQHVRDGWEESDVPPIQINQNEPLNRKERRAVARMMVSGKGLPKDKAKKKPENPSDQDGELRVNIAPQWKYSDETDESDE